MNKLITLLAFTFSACAAAPVAQPTMVPKPIALAWDLKHTDAAKWSATLLLELDKAKLAQIEPSDAGDYCPNYKKISQENRRIFWANLFAIIAKYESSYNPKSSSVDVGVVGNKDTYSVGLYQMSVVDQKNYRFKLGFMYDDLLDGAKNIQLAVPIAAHLIGQDNRIGGKVTDKWKGMTRYWAVMRLGSTSAYADKSAKSIRDYTRMLDACR